MKLTLQHLHAIPVDMVTISLPKGGEILKICSYSEEILSHQPAKLKITDVNLGIIEAYPKIMLSSLEHNLPQLLTIHNDFLNYPVEIIKAIYNPVSKELFKLIEIRNFYVSSKTLENRDEIKLEATSALNGKDQQLNKSVYTNYCQHEFKGDFCKYAGADKTCKYNQDDCFSKNNLQNFGGFIYGKN